MLIVRSMDSGVSLSVKFSTENQVLSSLLIDEAAALLWIQQ